MNEEVWLGLVVDSPGSATSPSYLATSVALPTGVAFGSLSAPYFPHSSTFLCPFAPRPLRRFFATTDALTPVRLSPTGQVSPVHPDDLPTIPSPTTPRSPTVSFARYPSARRASRIPPGLGFALHSQARRNARPNRVRLLRTGRLPPGASHPRLAAAQLPLATGPESDCPEGTFTPWSSELPGARVRSAGYRCSKTEICRQNFVAEQR